MAVHPLEFLDVRTKNQVLVTEIVQIVHDTVGELLPILKQRLQGFEVVGFEFVQVHHCLSLLG